MRAAGKGILRSRKKVKRWGGTRKPCFLGMSRFGLRKKPEAMRKRTCATTNSTTGATPRAPTTAGFRLQCNLTWFFRAVLCSQQHREEGAGSPTCCLPLTHSLSHYQHRPPEWASGTSDEPTLAHHHHPQSIVYVRAHFGVVHFMDVDISTT